MTSLKSFLLLTAAAGACFAQSANISGIWKADLTKSKLNPPPKEYLESIEQTGPRIVEKTRAITPFGEQRTALTFETDKQTIDYVFGVPSRLTSKWEGQSLNLKTEVAGHPSDGLSKTYELSGDGQTLTVTTKQMAEGRARESVLVLTKQPAEAGAPFQQPEEPAGKHYKNVKSALKDLPASEFIDQMHYFTWALGKDCEFCHVQRKFDSDDKEEKRTARQMIAMTIGINKDTFEGKEKVRCYTCHQFKEHPQLRPKFEGEPEHHEGEHHEEVKH
jgi:hypothetical protein